MEHFDVFDIESFQQDNLRDSSLDKISPSETGSVIDTLSAPILDICFEWLQGASKGVLKSRKE